MQELGIHSLQKGGGQCVFSRRGQYRFVRVLVSSCWLVRQHMLYQWEQWILATRVHAHPLWLAECYNCGSSGHLSGACQCGWTLFSSFLHCPCGCTKLQENNTRGHCVLRSVWCFSWVPFSGLNQRPVTLCWVTLKTTSLGDPQTSQSIL